jgi:D-alanyl-D-alanine carboxypeptidase
VNEFDDLDVLERELGPSLRRALRHVAADITDDRPPSVRGLNGDGARAALVEDPLEADAPEADHGVNEAAGYLDALRTRSSNVTLVDTEPTSTRPPRRRWPIVTAAAAVVAVVVGGLVLAIRDDPGGNHDPATPGTIVADTPPTTLDPQDAASVRVAERFLAARNAGDVATATSLLGDRVTVALIDHSQTPGSMPSVELTRDEFVLALNAERLYDVRYEPFVCHGSVLAVVCTSSVDSRLRRIEGLPPIESSVQVSVADGRISGVSLPWLSISAYPGGYSAPVEMMNFVHWLDGVHPDATPPVTGMAQPQDEFGPSQLLYWEGQELVQILTPHALDLLAGYLDEYEQFRATAADRSVSEIAADFVGDRPGGVSVLVTRDGVTTTGAAGSANAAGEPITPATPFRVGSVTMPFVATMVLQLADEGRIDLDASLSTYLPATPVGGNATIGALLSPGSGVPDYTRSPDWQADARADPSRWFTADEILGYVEAMGPTERDPYDGFSSTSYVLLGQLVERLDGVDLATALANRITGPLGLAGTRLATADQPGMDGLAGGWSSGDVDGIPLDGDPTTAYSSIVSSAGASGGLISTTGDLATFLHALFAGDLVSTEALTQMETTGTWPGGLSGLGPGTGISGVGHAGSMGGYASIMLIDPDTGDAVVALTNNDELGLERLTSLLALP